MERTRHETGIAHSHFAGYFSTAGASSFARDARIDQGCTESESNKKSCSGTYFRITYGQIRHCPSDQI